MANSEVIDQSFMRHALQLAQFGRYTTTPNPSVGCVIVNDNRVVGKGFHHQAGGPHAEVYALQQAGTLASGGTAYVTLEPCSHHGKTPPCADALIQAQLSRVVIAMQDPNPQVAGRGIQRLRDAGIAVTVGVLADDSSRINRGFNKRMTQKMPWLTTKLASSLDGRTALSNGKSQWITGEQARLDVHKLRAEFCAVLTGADTIVVDDPQLNVRIDSTDIYSSELANLPLRQPVKVVIDSQNRLTSRHQIFQMAGEVVVANVATNLSITNSEAMQANVTQWQLPKNGRYLDLRALMGKLAEAGFNNVWCEAGAALNGALLEANLVDELIVYQAPKLMGSSARPLFELPEFESMHAVPEFQIHSVEKIGGDLKLVLQQWAPR